MKTEKQQKTQAELLELPPEQQKLITCDVLDYAESLVSSMNRSAEEEDDLREACYFGLCMAAHHFDSTQKASFKTYSNFYMRKYMNKFLERMHPFGMTGMGKDTPVTFIPLDAYCQQEDTDEESYGMLCNTDAEEEINSEDLARFLLSQLTPLQRDVVTDMLGLNGMKISPQKIARKKGTTTSCVYKTYKNAIHKLKTLSRNV